MDLSNLLLLFYRHSIVDSEESVHLPIESLNFQIPSGMFLHKVSIKSFDCFIKKFKLS